MSLGSFNFNVSRVGGSSGIAPPNHDAAGQAFNTENVRQRSEVDSQIIGNQAGQIRENINPYLGIFELPLEGTRGFTSIPTNLYDNDGLLLLTMNAGDRFTILEENGDKWKVQLENGNVGWMENTYAMVNLPDLIPSMVYANSNASASVMTAGRGEGVAIPNITGERLYMSRDENSRLGGEEYVVPILYSTAKKLQIAQEEALARGYTLVIYEAFRPADVQKKIAAAMQQLYDNNAEVRADIDSFSSSISWFISTGTSNHQLGAAVDLTIAEIISHDYALSGEHTYKNITEYRELGMPTDMHRLGSESAVFTGPVSSRNDVDWRSANYSEAFLNSEGGMLLQQIMTEAGFSPLASEWWHFNDLEAIHNAPPITDGKFFALDQNIQIQATGAAISQGINTMISME